MGHSKVQEKDKDKEGNQKRRPSFPLFSGKDIQWWLYRVEQILDYFNYQEDQRVKMVAMYLEKGALG